MLNSTEGILHKFVHLLRSIYVFLLTSTTHVEALQHRKERVFISHNGDDKQTIAIPLRDRLKRAGYTAFVDDIDIPRGSDAVQTMHDHMEKADVFVIVLSRKYLVSEWPVKEMLVSLDRCKGCRTGGGDPPTIIPLFYSLLPREMEPAITVMYNELCESWNSNDPIPQRQEYHDAVITIRQTMGVINHYDANNQSDTQAKKRRDALLSELVTHILRSVKKHKDDSNPQDCPPHISLDLDVV